MDGDGGKAMAMLKNMNKGHTIVTEGKTCNIYCGQCGGILKQENMICYPHTIWSFRCSECKRATPLFGCQYDALKYYKDTFGATHEWVEKNN